MVKYKEESLLNLIQSLINEDKSVLITKDLNDELIVITDENTYIDNEREILLNHIDSLTSELMELKPMNQVVEVVMLNDFEKAAYVDDIMKDTSGLEWDYKFAFGKEVGEDTMNLTLSQLKNLSISPNEIITLKFPDFIDDISPSFAKGFIEVLANFCIENGIPHDNVIFEATGDALTQIEKAFLNKTF